MTDLQTIPYQSKPCPNCKNPSVYEFRPFCSRRCKDVDLNRWLTGSYVIPGKPIDGQAEQAIDPQSDDLDDEDQF